MEINVLLDSLSVYAVKLALCFLFFFVADVERRWIGFLNALHCQQFMMVECYAENQLFQTLFL